MVWEQRWQVLCGFPRSRWEVASGGNISLDFQMESSSHERTCQAKECIPDVEEVSVARELRVCVSVCVCDCVPMSVCVSKHVCTCGSMHICVSVCVHVWMCACDYMCVCVCARVDVCL